MGSPSPPIDMKVDIELTDGLTVTGTPTYASGTLGNSTVPASVNYSNGVFSVGTLKLGEATANAVTLPVEVASGAVVNNQCLTATLTGNPPPGTGRNDDDISDNVAKVCLGSLPPEPFDSGEVRTWTLYACKDGVAANMCDTAAEVDVRVLATVEGSREDRVLRNAPALIHVKDKPGRVFDANSGSVTDGTTVSWQTRTDLDPDFTGTRNGVKVGLYREPVDDYIDNWTNYHPTLKVSGADGGDPPGLISVRSRTSGAALWALTSGNSWSAKRTSPFSLSSKNDSVAFVMLEFEELGTYVLDFDVDMLHASIDDDGVTGPDTFSGTGKTIFHVGPIADIGVRDGGASPHVAADRNALTLVATNNGLERFRGARVTGLPKGAEVLHRSQGSYDETAGVWRIGELDIKGRLRDVGKPEGVTLVLEASAGDTVAAKVAYDPYLVCIGSDGSTLSHTTKTACEAVSGASWHEGTVYDYIDSDNTAVIRAACGTGGRPVRSPGTPGAGAAAPGNPTATKGTTTVKWDPIGLLDRVTTHNQYAVMQPRGTSYRVRAVNANNVAGPWSVTTA